MIAHFFVRFCFCLSVVLAGGSAWSTETNGPAAVLRPAVQVDGAGVFLPQLVEGQVPSATHVCLAPAPGLTQTLVLTRGQIAEALGKTDPALAPASWSGAEQVKITRRVRRLEENELKDLVTATLQREQVRDKGELELHLGRPWTPVTVPEEPLQVRVLELPGAGVTPNFILRFELRTERESLGNFQVPLQARIWRDLWVARSPQVRGRLLPEADLGTERRDLLLVRDALLTLDPADPSLELAESLSTGAPVLRRSLRVRPIVHRGKVLDAVVLDGAMMIAVKVEALEDGSPGQAIRVRNVRSRREFQGKVQNEQTVIVPL
jgi:flagellar basal body P-ring formation protein FlgA